MIRGTRIIEGAEARVFRATIDRLRSVVLGAGYEEVILPAIAEPSLWTERSGTEIEAQMWRFADKADRPVTLIPEATALIQREYRERWSKSRPKPLRLFYEQRCYRYERPQKGRYREFTQFGVEVLGPEPEQYAQETIELLKRALDGSTASCEFDDDAVRGLSYYTRNGFEVRCPILGAQKQVAGGGVYPEGCGWAIGVDRLVLAQMAENEPGGT